MMYEEVIAAITQSKGRKSLYHFTRTGNLPSIASSDNLWSSSQIIPGWIGKRRLQPVKAQAGEHEMTINANLRIAESMIGEGTTLEEFRAYLDRHVFFWPTVQDCRKMMATYVRREPGEGFAVLEFDAVSLLAEHASSVRLSKYDSGSSPRYPARTSYKKSPDMFVPLRAFPNPAVAFAPARASEIREVLIERRIQHVTRHLKAVFASPVEEVPRDWSRLARPLSDFPDKPV
ncbi:hypothetical protein [uncultured Paenibacillus sp.]|uniref:DUF7002 family protein n=1 Tax=uncultured Paenibacillus sp. TaxID=227322 RepID=UPI0015A88527|nr:hypothetical protein [uncultured Paenibacillus sp.]